MAEIPYPVPTGNDCEVCGFSGVDANKLCKQCIASIRVSDPDRLKAALTEHYEFLKGSEGFCRHKETVKVESAPQYLQPLVDAWAANKYQKITDDSNVKSNLRCVGGFVAVDGGERILYLASNIADSCTSESAATEVTKPSFFQGRDLEYSAFCTAVKKALEVDFEEQMNATLFHRQVSQWDKMLRFVKTQKVPLPRDHPSAKQRFNGPQLALYIQLMILHLDCWLGVCIWSGKGCDSNSKKLAFGCYQKNYKKLLAAGVMNNMFNDKGYHSNMEAHNSCAELLSEVREDTLKFPPRLFDLPRTLDSHVEAFKQWILSLNAIKVVEKWSCTGTSGYCVHADIQLIEEQVTRQRQDSSGQWCLSQMAFSTMESCLVCSLYILGTLGLPPNVVTQPGSRYYRSSAFDPGHVVASSEDPEEDQIVVRNSKKSRAQVAKEFGTQIHEAAADFAAAKKNAEAEERIRKKREENEKRKNFNPENVRPDFGTLLKRDF